MESITVENYLKAIYQLSDAPGGAATGELARRLKITPGSVTLMLQRLAEAGLVNYAAHQGVRLTKKGQKVAIHVVRNHRLLELYLANTLELPWDEVHEEAENLEHAVSDRLIARIDDYLGHPARDPHGDPIPDADGKMRTTEGTPLTECSPTTRFFCSACRIGRRIFFATCAMGGWLSARREKYWRIIPRQALSRLRLGTVRLVSAGKWRLASWYVHSQGLRTKNQPSEPPSGSRGKRWDRSSFSESGRRGRLRIDGKTVSQRGGTAWAFR